MKVLYFTSALGWPLTYGAEIRSWNVLQGLKAVGTVDAVVFPYSGKPLVEGAFAGCQRIMEIPMKYVARSARQLRLRESALGRAILTLDSTIPWDYRCAAPHALRASLEKVMRSEAYDLYWFATAGTAQFISPGRTASVLDGDDFAYVRNLLLLRSTAFYGTKLFDYLDVLKMRRLERKLPNRFSFVVRCSDEDRALQAARNVVVIPNGTTVPTVLRRNPSRRVLFVGVLGYPPNRHGVEWFIERVWPSIRRQFPDAMFDVVGRDPSPRILELNGCHGIEVHGFVDDLTPFYERAALSVVPLLAGAGTRLKILESLGRGVPVVSTSIGAYGIAAQTQHGVERVDGAEQFSDRCAELLTGLGPEAQARALVGREFVHERYDWEKIQRQVGALALEAVAQVRSDAPITRRVRTQNPQERS